MPIAPHLAVLIDRARSLNAIAAIDPDAFPQGDAPLVLVKDNIAVRGLGWTAGTPLFADVTATRDAAAVRLLRGAGAALPVKTTLHELAFGVTGANGWSGDILNPHDPRRLAGGSSGGSAAALAIGLGDLSLVTDTGGSARIPAAHCGIIGFRPSSGRYPADGLIGLSPSRDTIGLMARELGPMLWADALLSDEEATTAPALPLRIGVPDAAALGPLAADVATAFAAATALIEAAGHHIVPADLTEIIACDEACGFAIALHETHQSLLAAAPALAGRSFEDLLAAVATPDVAHMLQLAAGGEAVPPAAYAAAIGRDWPSLRRACAALFADGIDLLLTPTTPITAPPAGCGETVVLNGAALPAFPTYTRFTRPDSMAGLPSISLPFGVDADGLPIGMMLTGPRFADRAVLAAAERMLALPGWPSRS